LFKSFRQVPFLMPATTQPTTIEPAKSLYECLPVIEGREGVISASIMEGFNACDLFHTGPSVFAYAETQFAADKAADDLMDEILTREAGFSVEMLPPKEAVQKAVKLAESANRPVLLVDVQD